MSAEPMTAEEIAAVRERADAATPGPWVAQESEDNGLRGRRWIRGADSEWVADLPGAVYLRRDHAGNAAFIATARTDVPRLIATIEAERARVDTAEAQLAELRLVEKEQAQKLHAIYSGADAMRERAETARAIADTTALWREADNLRREAEARADAAEAKLAERSFTCDECAKHVLYGPGRDSWQDVTPL